MTEGSVSPTHSLLFRVMVMSPGWESVVCKFKYRFFGFWKERPNIISLISFENMKNPNKSLFPTILKTYEEILYQIYRDALMTVGINKKLSNLIKVDCM